MLSCYCADELVTRGSQAALRSAVSRAYYSAFCQARDRLYSKADRGATMPDRETHGSHERVWRAYRGRNGTLNARIGSIGFRLMNQRRKADYEAEYIPTADEVRSLLQSARQLIDLLPRV